MLFSEFPSPKQRRRSSQWHRIVVGYLNVPFGPGSRVRRLHCGARVLLVQAHVWVHLCNIFHLDTGWRYFHNGATFSLINGTSTYLSAVGVHRGAALVHLCSVTGSRQMN